MAAAAASSNGNGSDSGGSAGASGGYERLPYSGHLTLDIKTRSVEQTLVPLVHQITTLVNAKEKPLRSERALNALVRVGQAVNMAVDRFVRVGEAIAVENPEIQQEMGCACREARIAGSKIEKLTDVQLDEPETVQTIAEKTAIVKAARQLLSAISRVLILADRVVIKQLIATKDKVAATLKKIECCTNFTEFVQIFSQFGNEMVQLAHASGDRQNDLKSEKSRAQMGVARAVLEKSTMLLLTAAKTYLRHHDNQLAKQNRNAVIGQMTSALNLIHFVVTDGFRDGGSSSGGGGGGGGNDKWFAEFLTQNGAAFKAIKELEDQAETVRVTLVNSSIEQSLSAACNVVMETVQDFTDSAYTNHEDRELILVMCERLKHSIVLLLRSGFSVDQPASPMATQMKNLDVAILKTKEACKALKKQLVSTAMDHASNVFRLNEDEALINDMKLTALEGNMQAVDELVVQFEGHSEQMREVCKLLRHISGSEPLLIWSAHLENTVKTHTPQFIQSCRILCTFPQSKMALENFQVFSDTWVNHVNDLSILVKDISDFCMGKVDKQVYLSLPRPGKHGANTRGLKPINLNNEEQAKIAKTGLEMKLITSELDAEADRWIEPENEIVRRAKNMSCMAFSIYLFTRGEGPLKNTRDLFVQADYFAEEGTKLYKTAREFSKQVPQSTDKNELIFMLDSVPSYCQHLTFTVRSITVGKAATFNKVDQVIQDTKDLMNAIAKLVTSCYVCATKYNIAYSGQLVGPWNIHSSSSPPSSSSGNDSASNNNNNSSSRRYDLSSSSSNNNNKINSGVTMATAGGSMNRDWGSSKPIPGFTPSNNNSSGRDVLGFIRDSSNYDNNSNDVEDFLIQHKQRQRQRDLNHSQQHQQQHFNNSGNLLQQKFITRHSGPGGGSSSNGSGSDGAALGGVGVGVAGGRGLDGGGGRGLDSGGRGLDGDTFHRSLSLTSRSTPSSIINNNNINNYDKL